MIHFYFQDNFSIVLCKSHRPPRHTQNREFKSHFAFYLQLNTLWRETKSQREYQLFLPKKTLFLGRKILSLQKYNKSHLSQIIGWRADFLRDKRPTSAILQYIPKYSCIRFKLTRRGNVQKQPLLAALMMKFKRSELEHVAFQRNQKLAGGSEHK